LIGVPRTQQRQPTWVVSERREGIFDRW
jgi:hypothetical protein